MNMGIGKFLKRILPVTDNERYCLSLLRDDEEYDTVKNLVRQKKASFELRNFNITIFEDGDYFQLFPLTSEPIDDELLRSVNHKLKEMSLVGHFKKFSEYAYGILPNLIAPEVPGMEEVKRAVALQLFSKESLHIMLIGDLNLKRTDFLESAADFAAHSVIGNPVHDTLASAEGGMLAKANNGLAAITNLNGIKRTDRSILFNVMDRGYVTFERNGVEIKYDTNVNLLACAVPSGNKFMRTFESIRDQIPFDPLFMQRFHLVFVMREPDVTTVMKHKENPEAKLKLRQEDYNFIRAYVKWCLGLEVSVPKRHEDEIISFVDELKKKEYSFLYKMSPRVVLGLVRLAKCSARLEMRDMVNDSDIERAKNLLSQSLKV